MNHLEETKDQTNQIFYLFDRYLKANNNFLPLQAYLQYLENENFDAFTSICHFKSFFKDDHSGSFSKLSSPNSKTESALNSNLISSDGNLGSTLTIINKTNNLTTSPNVSPDNSHVSPLASVQNQTDVILAQKLYKIIISIDYSPQTTSLDFVSKSLEKIFEKISNEYNEFYQACSNVEPQVYVTVLVWNLAYFDNVSARSLGKSSTYDLKNSKLTNHLPFCILCLSKRLLKSNLQEIHKFVFKELLDIKHLFLDPLKAQETSENQYHYDLNGEPIAQTSRNLNDKISSNSKSVLNKENSSSSFEELLDNIIKIFNYFVVNEFSTATMAPTALALCHHIHITDGLIYSTDMIHFLEKISRSSISFSFIYSGSNNLQSGSNISSGFGFLAVHFLMKFLAQATNGFYAVIDENLVYTIIFSRNLLQFFNMCLPISRVNFNSSFNQTENYYSVKNSEKNKTDMVIPPDQECKIENIESEETRDSFCQKETNVMRNYERINVKNHSKFGSTNKIFKQRSIQNILSLKRDYNTEQVKYLLQSSYNEKLDFKCIQKYELSHKNISINQIARIRCQEGFYLVKVERKIINQFSSSVKSSNSSVRNSPSKAKTFNISASESNSNSILITLYFKRYFTQTIKYLYKVSYIVACQNAEKLQVENEQAEAKTLLQNIPKMTDMTGESTDINSDFNLSHNNTSQLSNQTSKVKLAGQQENKKFFVEIWLSWNFLHVKSKYQNLVLIEKVRKSLISIRQVDFDRSFDITTFILNPPEILKLKEPLFKISISNPSIENNFEYENSTIYHRNKVGNLIFSIGNLNYELNMRSNKITTDQFIDFAQSWVYLSFDKYNKNVMDRHFGIHNLKLVLNYDRPMPDTNSVLFDMKNIMVLMKLEMISNGLYGTKNVYYDNLNNLNDNSLLSQEHIATLNNLGYANALNRNQNSTNNNIFQCKISLTKLCAMLIEWSDIMLVENCVYLKFLTSSTYYLKPNNKKRTQKTSETRVQSPIQQTHNKSGSKANLSETDQNTLENSKIFSHAKPENDQSTTNLSDRNKSKSQHTVNKSPQDQINNTNNVINHEINDASIFGTKRENINSFVIIKLETQNVPFVSIQFIFHSNINYHDRIRLLEVFNEKIRDLNLKNVQSSIHQAQQPVSSSSIGSINSTLQNAGSFPSGNQSFEDTKKANAQEEFYECCQLLHKPDLYETLFKIFIDDELNSKHTLSNYNILGQIRSEYSMFNSPKILNFLHQKKFKWILNSSFSFDAALNLKETIVDAFIRMRLKEGFKCLFQSPKFAIFTMQLTMFDSGDISSQFDPNLSDASKFLNKETSKNNTDEPREDMRRHSAKNFSTFKNGSSQICTFVYVVRFFSNLSQLSTNISQILSLSQQKASFTLENNASKTNRNNNGLLNVIGGNNAENLFYLDNSKRFTENFQDVETSNNKKDENQGNQPNLDMTDLEISFTTEMYVEAIDGIYREKKSTSLSNSTFSINSKKILRDKLKNLRNFRNLTNSEIINLIYLTDLKCFSAMQSSYALFLSKIDPIANLTNLLKISTPNSFQSQQYFHSSSNLINIYEFDSNYFDSIRILPDLNIIPKSSLVKLNKNNKMSSVRSTYLINRIKFNKNLNRQTKTNNPSKQENEKFKRLFSEDNSLRFENNQKRRSSIESKDKTKNFDNNFVKETIPPKKIEKNASIALHDQLRPVLDRIDTNCSLIDVSFQFTLRGILLESSLYVCVFEDVPLNLFNQTSKSQVLTENEIQSIRKIQNLFFKNIDEKFKKFEEINIASKSGLDRDADPCQHLHENMSKELKNVLILRLSDIKSGGDSIGEQLIDDLKMQIQVESEINENANEIPRLKNNKDKYFGSYLKFNIAQITARHPYTVQQQSHNNMNNHNIKTNDINPESIGSFAGNSKPSINFLHQQNQQEIENNNFVVFGLFFLNSSENSKKYETSNSPSSNLVFFLFDSIPENIKDSLLNNNTNTYLIRKPLFTSQKIFQKSNSSHQPMDSNISTNKVSFLDTYRFYNSKTVTNQERNIKSINNTDFNLSKTNSNNSGNSTFNSTIPTPTNLIKKCYSITDILKYHLLTTTSSTNFFSLNCINFIEENCAKSYIKSVIHFMGIYAMEYAQRTLTMQNITFNFNLTSEKSDLFDFPNTATCKQKFEANSISSLLKIAKKNKIVDLDLTDFLKKNCLHLKNQKSDDLANNCCLEKKCSNNQEANSMFLEKKFNELFLKNFTLLPGFNDMFIFTTFQQQLNQNQANNENIAQKSKLQKMNSWHKRRAASLLIIEQELNDSNLTMDNENEEENENDANFFFTNDLKNISSSESCEECETTSHNSDSSSSVSSTRGKRRRNRSLSTTSSFSDGHNMELDNEESIDENELNLDAFDDCAYYPQENATKNNKDDRKSKENDDDNEFIAEKLQRVSTKTLSKNKRNEFTRKSYHSSNRINYSESFSSKSNKKTNKILASNEATKLQSTVSPSSLSGLNLMNEQIIGLEFVCIIGSNVVNTLDELEDRRTRTTTLTPETENLDTHDISEKTSETNSNLDTEQSKLTNIHQHNMHKLPNQIKKKIFYSKFQKLNISCILDLIEEKDLEEFSNIVKKFESSKTLNETGSFSTNNVKVYLRFNWYSFNELNSVNHNHSNFASILSNANSISTSKMFGPVNVAGTVMMTKSSKVIASSNSNISSLQSTSQKGQLSLNETLSTHSSSSTVYNHNIQSSQHDSYKFSKMHHKFEYYHLLYPKIYEFKWHLKDEIFQIPYLKYRNIRMLHALTVHIREGVKRKHKHCHYEKRKVVLNRKTTTTITSIVEAKPMTNAAKLLSSNSTFKTTTTKVVEEDKTIFAVDTNKFYKEFIEVFKTLNGKFYKSKLHQLNESFFYLNCIYTKDNKSSDQELNGSLYTFKIIIHISKDENKLETINSDNVKNQDKEHCSSSKKTPSPSSLKNLDTKHFSSASLGQISYQPSRNAQQNVTNNKQFIENQDISRHLLKNSLLSNQTQQKYANSNLPQQHLKKSFSQQTQQNISQQQHHQQPPEIKHETHIGQIKMKIYFSFNHTSFENKEELIKKLIAEFNQKIDELIKSIYLTLSLREIHETRKWNNLLHLSENTSMKDKPASQILNDELSDEILNQSIKSTDTSNSKDLDETFSAHSKENINEMGKNTLTCNCVWTILFKLHRLHQTRAQKSHGTVDLTPSSASILSSLHQQTQQSQQPQQQQQQSHGLKKLQEALINFKIDDANCDDLYVYTKNNDIYLLKIEEVYEASNVTNNTSTATTNTISSQSHQNFQNLTVTDINTNLNENSLNVNDSSIEINENLISASFAKIQQQQQNIHGKINMLPRRPSYGSIQDIDSNVNIRSSNNYNTKSHNLSGGSINTLTASVITTTTGTSNTISSSNTATSSSQQRLTPEYIKLSVYGLQEPDEEMKHYLCKTLQTELDHLLLTRMCNSIEKNTYKTTSAQHPDKITDEDLNFFKQMCDNYFDFEILLPFVFNFNKTLRENFFYFVKHIFNLHFKTIDATGNGSLPFSSSNIANFTKRGSQLVTKNEKEANTDCEYDEVSHLKCKNPINSNSISNSTLLNVSTSSQPVSAMFTQQSFSYMSMHPCLGPFEGSNQKNASTNSIFQSNNPKATQLDSYVTLLTRILFHNSKSIRIGKHSVSLVLVEALYAIRGLEYLVSSRITRSNSSSSNANNNLQINQQAKPNQLQQFLETSYTHSKQTGPTFVFRFYCRGENDTNAYKECLKSALNEALLYFLSEYLTRIDPELYLKQIQLKRKPALFRNAIFDFDVNQLKVEPDETEKFRKNRKRHKSMGNEKLLSKETPKMSASFQTYNNMSECPNGFILRMNKSARETKLGKLLISQKITNENELINFVTNNLSNNLFDHRDYEDTIEYFRESIKNFDYNYILNNMAKRPLNSLAYLSFIGIENYENSSDENETNSSSSVSSTNSLDSFSKKERKSSLSTDSSEVQSENYDNTKMSKNRKNHQQDLHEKSYLRIIYDWLKGLYLMQIRSGPNNLSRSSYPTQSSSLNNRRETLTPIVTPSSASPSIQISPLQQQNQQPFQPIQSPFTCSTTCSLSTSSLSNNSSFILRKKINYLTKYNLTNLLRDFELNLRETCKCELNTSYYSFKTTTDLKKMNKKSSSNKNTPSTIEGENEKSDNVFLEDLKLLEDQGDNKANRSKLYRKFSYNQCDQSQKNISSNFEVLDDCDLDKDFPNLKQTKFSNLHNNLSKFENIIVTINVEYCNAMSGSSTITGTGLNSTNPILMPISMSSSVNMSNSSSTAYTRVPSFAGSNFMSNSVKENSLITSATSTNSSATLLTSITSSSSSSSTHSGNTLVTATNTNFNIPTNTNQASSMMKSMSSNSSDLDSSMSFSNSLALAHLQLKRTFCYAIVNSKTKMITFYCFTTESCNYDSIKLLLDQASELINQRYNLVNNAILYKFGGLIGDTLLYDLKKVKSVSLSACFRQSNLNEETLALDETKSNTQTLAKANNSAIQKLSKSPIIHRQLSYSKSSVNPINPSLINNLQFLNSDKNTTWDSKNTQQQINSNIGNQVSINYNPTLNLSTSSVQIKQLCINSFNQKSYDSIVNIINKQLEFCSFYLTNNSAGAQGLDSPLSVFNSNLKVNALSQNQFNNSNRSFYSNQNFPNSSSSNFSLYGVGLCYQLFEMQQIYRHPRKIYDLALSLSNTHSPTNTSSSFKQPAQISTTSINKDIKIKASTINSLNNLASNSVQVPFKNQLNINDFYKNNILPVLVPLHYCCTPILFYPNWTEIIVTENSLKFKNSNRLTSSRTSDAQLNNSNNRQFSSLNGSSKTGNIISTESWYSKMRQSVLIEYSKYFESRGFVKLKEDKGVFSTDTNLKPNNSQQEFQINHFIKWIQQDGFLYITFNIEEIYLHVKLGYCARYRSTSRSFVNEIIKFLTQEFHVHSFIHDFHLTAINQNFSSSITGSQISQTSHTIAKFLDEFVDFFLRIPIYSINKVFKRVYEKSDHSLIPHQFKLIFDFVIDSITKINSENEENQLLFKTLYVFDNNIAIYSLTDGTKSIGTTNNAINSDYLKYLVIKIEAQSVATSSVNWSSSTSIQSYVPSSASMTSKKQNQSIKGTDMPKVNASTANFSKLSNSNSSSSLLGPTAQQQQLQNNENLKQEPLIRIISYYLCINKNQSTQQSKITHGENNGGSTLASISLLNKFKQDINCIDRVIEESISLYKQELFWDNLSSTISPLTDFLNENSNTNMNYPSISFSVKTEELEQILAISEKIDILELDPSLNRFLKECYSIKEKIREYITFSFGRHFIYTSSTNVEYCLLLINDELLRKFRQTFATSSSTPAFISSQSSSLTLNEEQIQTQKKNVNTTDTAELKSFVLLKFDKINKKTSITQINRVKISIKDQNQNKTISQNQIHFNSLNKRSSTTDTISSINSSSTEQPILSSSLKNLVSAPTNNNNNSWTFNNVLKSHKFLNFTINTLMYVLWENIVSST